MQYLEFTFTLTPDNEALRDVLSASLAENGFDSFVDTAQLEETAIPHAPDPEHPAFTPAAETGVYKAYIQQALFDQAALDELIENFPLPGVKITYTQEAAEDKDWNEEWERNYFQPLTVDGRCVVASTFHKDVPEAEYNIRINPQMSFGTGHHATTSQMISRLLDADLRGKTVLDMGCGTGILAILARMRGAARCEAVDVDEWCVKNTRENIALNPVDGIDVTLGDASSLAAMGPFDLIIANINLGILIHDMKAYAARLKEGGEIYLSGFYVEDVPQLLAETERQGLTLIDSRSKDGWACIRVGKLPHGA